MRSTATMSSLLVLGFVVGAAPAAAHAAGPGAGVEWQDGGAAPPRQAAASAHAEAITLDRAVEMVQRRHDAKVVRAEETRDGDDVVYRIRLLSADGRVFTVRVNARTGQMD
jgi:uncharacterized membrane protein YkoI